ncbi:Uncharacterized protein dnm_001030 [Desulfonema magnum]|uniref:Uncharacterized protein n=1 Tax=Desulfonema magnum TaxID=45655 RepID=A0A975BF35_9BACT|nr:Uncharacterized protein dnm_001030 [Desulfonema magnum]
MSKNFSYIFFSAKGEETRTFSSWAAGHSGKKTGFLFRTIIENLWLGTYQSLRSAKPQI